MAVFSYKAYDNTGQVVTGNVNAPDQNSARTELKQQGFSVVSIEARAENTSLFGLFKSNKVSLDDL